MYHKLIYSILTCINCRLLGPLERFIRRLNESLLQETKIKSIGNTVTILNGNSVKEIEEGEYNELKQAESAVGLTVEYIYHNDKEIEIRTSLEAIVNNLTFEYRICNKYINTIESFCNKLPMQNLFLVLSLIIFTLVLGSLAYLATKFSLPKKKTAGEERYIVDSYSILGPKKDSWELGSSIPNNILTDFDDKGTLYVNAKASITGKFSKKVSDILNNNPPFFSYDFIIDEYVDSETTDYEYKPWNCLSNFNLVNFKQEYLTPVDSKHIGKVHTDSIEYEYYCHPGTTGDRYVIPHSDSSLGSAEPSSPRTIESDIQNNKIVTDDEFENNQQYCLQSLLNLYNESHNKTISCFPIKVQTDFKYNNIETNVKDKYSAPELESQNSNIEPDFNESEYIDMYSDSGKRNKPFTKLSRTKYSPLYSRPKFELSRSTTSLISNHDQDPLIFFDLYDYLSLLDLNDRLDSLEILSHEYTDDVSQVTKLIEFEILNLCTTSNEAEIQDTAKKLQYIFSTEYNGDNPSIPKIIQMYSNSFKSHLDKLIGLLQTQFGETIVLLICDYLSFADNNKITIETYNYCLEAIFESIESNIDCCKILSNSACIIVCALDFKMLEYTFFQIFNQIFTNRTLQMNKLIAALSSLKYYICFNKKNILEELAANPMENKVECCGYKLLNLLASNSANILQLAQKYKIKKKSQISKYHKSLAGKSNTNPLILELIDTYLVIIEIFLNNDQVPSAVQYEFLSSFITRIYTELKPIVEQDTRTLDPPLLKELQVYFELSNSQLR